MTTFFYIVTALIVLSLAWFALKLTIGVLMPLEESGYAYLQQLLKRMGINELVTPACLRECVAESTRFATLINRDSGSKAKARLEMAGELNVYADMLCIWIRGNDSFVNPEQQRYKKVFQKHGVRRLGN